MARSALTGAKLGAEDLGEGADVELAVMGNRAGQGSRVPQLIGSTPPNASGAMAIPQDLWHRTKHPRCFNHIRLICPFSTFLVSDLDQPFCHPRGVIFVSTPMHHLMIMVSSAASGRRG